MRLGWLVFAGVGALLASACSSSSGHASPDGGNPGRDGESGRDVASPRDGGGSDHDAGGKQGGGPPDTGTATDAQTTADTGPGPYPAGPYGVTVGSVIENMQWIGYDDPLANVVATMEPYAPYSLDDARRSGKRYAMVNLAESDCPGCQKSAGEIEAGGMSVVDAGGVVIEVLETTGFVAQATMASLDAWIGKYSLPVTTVKDPDGTGTPTLSTLGGREQAYIIDLKTMTILQIIEGDTTGIGATSGGKALTAMHTLLGK